MKLIIRGPGDASLLTEDGRDLIPELGVSRISVNMEGPGEFPTLDLHCVLFGSQAEIEVEAHDIRVNLEALQIHHIEGPTLDKTDIDDADIHSYS